MMNSSEWWLLNSGDDELGNTFRTFAEVEVRTNCYPRPLHYVRYCTVHVRLTVLSSTVTLCTVPYYALTNLHVSYVWKCRTVAVK